MNGATNVVTWTKGVGDGVDGVDIEMSRLSQDGLIFVARDGEWSPLWLGTEMWARYTGENPCSFATCETYRRSKHIGVCVCSWDYEGSRQSCNDQRE